MPGFDAEALRAAIAEFVPQRIGRFQNLEVAKDMIAELRRKRASYDIIADLLTRHGLTTSRSAVANFCHEVLAEQRHGRRRRRAAKSSGAALPEGPPLGSAQAAAEPPPATSLAPVPPTPKKRGPRVARLQFSQPDQP